MSKIINFSFFFGLVLGSCFDVASPPPVSAPIVGSASNHAAEASSPLAANRPTTTPAEIDTLSGKLTIHGSPVRCHDNFPSNAIITPRRVELAPRQEGDGVVVVPNGVRLWAADSRHNRWGCEMKNQGAQSLWWWRTHHESRRSPKRSPKRNTPTINAITLADAVEARDEFVAKMVVTTVKALGFIALLPVIALLGLIIKAGEVLMGKPEVDSASPTEAFPIEDLQTVLSVLEGSLPVEEVVVKDVCPVLESTDALIEDIKRQRRMGHKLLWGSILIAGLMACDVEAAGLASAAPVMYEGEAAEKARRLAKRTLASVAGLKLKIERAQNYRIFPTLTVIGEGHGSQGAPTLRGTNPQKKNRAPKCILTASGQNAAAVIRNLPEVNARRKKAGKDEWEVGVTDILFTEFRGTSPRSIVEAMKVMGYVPAGPGMFVRLGPNTEYNKWLLAVCRTAKDLRSYGRSHTTSPVLEHISHKIAVHFVSLKAMGIDTDGSSYITQGIHGIASAAFQIRMVSTPSDLWTWTKMMAGIIKGLILQAKIVKNVTTGEAEWVDKVLWKKLLKTNIQDEHCPIVEVEGVKYQAGLFIDTSNMAKCDMKTPVKALGDGKKVTTISHQEHFISFIIAEQFVGRTSIGWQTLQLIPKVILEKHRDALRGKISTKLQRYLDGDFSESFTEKLTSKFNGLSQIAAANIRAINLMGKLSGKATLRMVFGGGLQGHSDYVLEMGDLPAGYAIHNGPKKAREEAGLHKLLRMMMSRYPQQGFESLVYLKVLSATQIGELYNWYVLGEKDDESKNPCPSQQTDLKAFVAALDAKVGSDHERFKLVLTAMKCSLPFVKAGCAILSHDDQFGRLRGDADGDKNFWSYDKTLVAIVQEMDKVTRAMRLPRLEIAGDGMNISKAFDKSSYLELCEKVLTGKQKHSYRAVANLLCAANNGQGPVGLIANMSTVPLSRLNWSIQKVEGEDRLVWEDEASELLFAYLLLMQQTAIDMQKRIYPAMSLLNWAMAMLFPLNLDTAEALTAPSAPGKEDGHYMSLSEDERIWSMSTEMHMHIPAYQEGLMYNEKALSHWLAWVVNGIIFKFDFLNNDGLQAASEVLHKEGVEAFFSVLAEMSGIEASVLEKKWLFVEDLTSWKKEANLEKIKGMPAEGIRFVWGLVIEVYADLKAKAGLNGASPIEHLAASCTPENRDEAAKGVIGKHAWTDGEGKIATQKFHLVLRSLDCVKLFRVFAKLTDEDSKEIAESERQQGDKPKDPSQMKQMLRMMFDDPSLTEGITAHYRLLTATNTPMGEAMPLGLMLNKLFSNNSNWSASKRREVLLALCRVLHSNIVVLAADGGAASISDAVKIMALMRRFGLLKDKGFDKVRPDSYKDEAWDAVLEKNEGWINFFSKTWAAEQTRPLRTAVKRYGWPTVTDKGDFGITVSGAGFPSGGANVDHMMNFLVELASYNKRPQLLKVAEWLADSVWPVMGLVWDLCDEQMSRQALLGDSAILEDQTSAISFANIHAYAQAVVETAILQRITLKKLLIEALWDVFPGGKKDDHLLRYRLEALIDSHQEKELFLVDDDDLQTLLSTVGTARFQRKILAQLRPMMACARVKDWLKRWHDWGATADREGNNALTLAAYVNGNTFKAMFNSTFQKENGEIVHDEYGTPIEKRRWLKSRVEITIPAKFLTEFFHEVLIGEESASGLYILCPESRAKGRYSVGRWVYFDSLTYRLATKNMVYKGKKVKEAAGRQIMKLWLSAHLEPTSPLSLGMAYHSQHVGNVVTWVKSWGDADGVNIPFVGRIEKEVLMAGIDAVDKFLQGYVFDFSLKDGKKSQRLGVFLPYFFGCNNKLTGPGDYSKWFLSSKLWMTLLTFGLVDFNGGMPPQESKRVFELKWGVKYPSNRDPGMADLANSGVSEVKTKEPLPWLQEGTPVEIERSDALRDLVLSSGFGPTGLKVQGFPAPQQCLEMTLGMLDDSQLGLDPTQVSPHKAICAFMGLSSVEYQFENLKANTQSEYHKAIARSWSGIAVSGLRDLFGGLGEYSGWSVGNTHYVGHAYTLSTQTVRTILAEFWKKDAVVLKNAHERASRLGVSTTSEAPDSTQQGDVCPFLEQRKIH